MLILKFLFYTSLCGMIIGGKDFFLSQGDLQNLFGSQACLKGIFANFDSTANPLEIPVDQTGVSHDEIKDNLKNGNKFTALNDINQLAVYNHIDYQYRLLSMYGPAHKRHFAVSLEVGDGIKSRMEEYRADGPSVKEAQRAAAMKALSRTSYPKPPKNTIEHVPDLQKRFKNPMDELEHVLSVLGLSAKIRNYKNDQLVGSTQNIDISEDVSLEQNIDISEDLSLEQNIDVSEDVPVVFLTRVFVEGQSYNGIGLTLDEAKQIAAASALQGIKYDYDTCSAYTEDDSAECSALKSPISMVYEICQKINVSVKYTLNEERGPPHSKIFKFNCKVGAYVTEGEGSSKQRAKENASNRMLNFIYELSSQVSMKKIKPAEEKKKSKNTKLIKMAAFVTNPIVSLEEWVSRNIKHDIPNYKFETEMVEGTHRHVVHCFLSGIKTTGTGSTKNAAKKEAAHNMLQVLGLHHLTGYGNPSAEEKSWIAKKFDLTKETFVKAWGKSAFERLSTRLHKAARYFNKHNTVYKKSGTETESFEPNVSNPKAKLMSLSKKHGFQVTFADLSDNETNAVFSLVSISTTPPLFCYGKGITSEVARINAAISVLENLDDIDLTVRPTPNFETKYFKS